MADASTPLAMGERRTDYVHAEDARIRTVKDELEHAIGRKHAPAQAAVVRGHPNLGVVARGDGLLLRQPVVADLWDRPDPHGERPRRLVRRAQRRRRRRTRGPLEHRVDSALCLARAGCTRGMHAREIIRSARHAPRNSSIQHNHPPSISLTWSTPVEASAGPSVQSPAA